MSTNSVSGKVVALTGGARGIGLETVKMLAAQGAKVGVGDLDLELLNNELGTIRGEVAGFELNVADRDSFEAFIHGVENQFGQIDILVNNAGVMALGPFLEEDDAVADRTLNINVRGPMLGMKIVLPGMIARGRGHVINIASSASRFGVPNAATYAASKFGVLGLTESVAIELEKTPIHFTAICPVIVNTDLTRGVTGKTRLVPTLEPEDVTKSVLKAIAKPRVVVYVPDSVKYSYVLSVLVPRSVRRVFERWAKSDALTHTDPATRAEYESRAFGDEHPTEHAAEHVDERAGANRQ